MAEPNVAENKTPQIASIGAPQKVTVNLNGNGNGAENVETNTNGNAPIENKTTTIEAENKKPEFTEEALKEYFKSKGIEYEGDEKLKEKLNYKPSTEPTEEQKIAQAKVKEKRLLDKWIAGGGTAETYVGVKSIADTDVAQLSINAAKKELKDLKFTDEQIDKILKDRYFQFDDDEIEQEEDESDKDFKKRLKEYGANKLANRSSHTKKQAQEILAGLNKAIEDEDLDVQDELSISANIDEKFKSVQLKDTYEIGEINGKPIPPIESLVLETEIAEVHNMLKDPDKRNNLLFNTDGSFNYNNIADVLIENKKLKSALKVSYHEGSTRTNEAWQKTFPHETAYAIGVGGSSNKNTEQQNRPVSAGKNQRISRPATT